MQPLTKVMLSTVAAISTLAITGTTPAMQVGGVLFGDASREEYEEVEALGSDFDSYQQELDAYDRLLAKSPTNREARYRRARQLMRLGRLVEAKRDLDYIESRSPTYEDLRGVQARLAEIAGRKQDVVTAYEKMVEEFPRRSKSFRIVDEDVREYTWVLDEVKGRYDKAEKTLKQLVAEKDEKQWRRFSLLLGKFYARRGDYAKALKHLQWSREAVADDPNPISRVLIDNYLVSFYWQFGKKEKALALSLKLVEEMDKIDNISGFDRLLTFKAVVLTRNGVGSPGQKKQADKLLERAIARRSKKNRYPCDIALSYFKGDVTAKEVHATLSKFLKKAPHLGWATSAAMYVGLSDKKNRHLLELLPKDSGKRRLVQITLGDRDGKAPRP